MLAFLLVGCLVPDPSPAVTAPLMGGGLAVHPEGRMWVSDSDRNRLVLLAPDGEVLREVPVPVASLPNRIAFGQSRAAVVLRGPGAVRVFDADGDFVGDMQPCPEPRGMLAEGDHLWLACAGGELVSMDVSTVQITSSVWVESDLRDVVRDGEDLWVSRFRRAELLRVDPVTGDVLERRRPDDVDADEMAVNAVSDPFSAFAAWRTVARPDGGIVMLHQRGADGPVDVSTPSIQPYYDPELLRLGGAAGIVHSALTVFGTDGTVRTGNPIPSTGMVVDLAIDPEGHMLVAHSAVEEPWGASVMLDHIDGQSVQASRGPGHGAAVAFDADGTPLTLTRYPLALVHDARTTIANDDAPRGFDLFHRATRSGMACASCHMEGHEDGRVWNFTGSGPLRTQDVSHVGGTAPFHWKGDLADMSALMGEVHQRRMGTRDQTDPERAGQAIQQFLDQVAPLRPSVPVSLGATVERGAAVFEEADCASCHSAPLPSESFDVGTGGAFQTPRLQALAMRLPLMHDGCASTIEERFDPVCGGTAHGDTQNLPGGDFDALVAYLGSL